MLAAARATRQLAPCLEQLSFRQISSLALPAPGFACPRLRRPISADLSASLLATNSVSPCNAYSSRRHNSASSEETSSRFSSSSSSSSFSYGALTAAGWTLLTTIAGATVFAHAEESDEAVEADSSEGTEQTEGTAEETKPAKKKSQTVTHSYKYVIVGCGQAGYNALRAIKHLDPEATVLVVNEAPQLPYDRPPLSKNLWAVDDPKKLEFTEFEGGPTESLHFVGEEDFQPPVTLKKGAVVYGIKPSKRFLVLQNANDETEMVNYEKLLLATGAEPRVIENIDSTVIERVSTFRDLEDFEYLYELTSKPVHLTVVGGGVLGTELALSLSKRPGVKVTQVVATEGLLGKVLPPALAEDVTKRSRAAGIELVCGERVVSIARSEADDQHVKLNLTSGQSLESEHVVLAIGSKPRTSIAKEAQLECGPNGELIVNAELQASISNIYGAGDAVSFWDQNLRRRRQIGHYEFAVQSGQTAGFNMVAKDGNIFTQDIEPIWWSPLPGGVEIIGVGVIDSSLETYSVFLEAAEGEENKLDLGIVYYLAPGRSKRVVGVLLWNHPSRMESARKLVVNPTYVKDTADLINKIPLYPPPQRPRE